MAEPLCDERAACRLRHENGMSREQRTAAGSAAYMEDAPAQDAVEHILLEELFWRQTRRHGGKARDRSAPIRDSPGLAMCPAV